MSNWKKTGRATLGFGLRLVVVMVVLEGVASLLTVGWMVLSQTGGPDGRGHTRYDEELGWSSKPGALIRNLYGPGAHVSINSQGLRAERDYDQTVPAGRLRVVCSGDSFTFGHGVGDYSTWPRLLETLEPRFEVLNLGQGAYGLDQSYLWYRRDAAQFDHQVHLLCFITDDLRRMQRREFNQAGKPLLRVVAGELVTENVPVPRRGVYLSAAARRLRPIWDLRSVQALAGFFQLLRAGASPPGSEDDLNTEQIQVVVRAILDDLQQRNRADRRILALVHLPVKEEIHAEDSAWKPWRAFFVQEALARGVAFADLEVEFETLSLARLNEAFELPQGGALQRPRQRCGGPSAPHAPAWPP